MKEPKLTDVIEKFIAFIPKNNFNFNVEFDKMYDENYAAIIHDSFKATYKNETEDILYNGDFIIELEVGVFKLTKEGNKLKELKTFKAYGAYIDENNKLQKLKNENVELENKIHRFTLGKEQKILAYTIAFTGVISMSVMLFECYDRKKSNNSSDTKPNNGSTKQIKKKP